MAFLGFALIVTALILLGLDEAMWRYELVRMSALLAATGEVMLGVAFVVAYAGTSSDFRTRTPAGVPSQNLGALWICFLATGLAAAGGNLAGLAGPISYYVYVSGLGREAVALGVGAALVANAIGLILALDVPRRAASARVGKVLQVCRFSMIAGVLLVAVGTPTALVVGGPGLVTAAVGYAAVGAALVGAFPASVLPSNQGGRRFRKALMLFSGACGGAGYLWFASLVYFTSAGPRDTVTTATLAFLLASLASLGAAYVLPVRDRHPESPQASLESVPVRATKRLQPTRSGRELLADVALAGGVLVLAGYVVLAVGDLWVGLILRRPPFPPTVCTNGCEIRTAFEVVVIGDVVSGVGLFLGFLAVALLSVWGTGRLVGSMPMVVGAALILLGSGIGVYADQGLSAALVARDASLAASAYTQYAASTISFGLGLSLAIAGVQNYGGAVQRLAILVGAVLVGVGFAVMTVALMRVGDLIASPTEPYGGWRVEMLAYADRVYTVGQILVGVGFVTSFWGFYRYRRMERPGVEGSFGLLTPLGGSLALGALVLLAVDNLFVGFAGHVALGLAFFLILMGLARAAADWLAQVA